MHRVYQAINPIDAHLVKHALEAEGIPAFVLGEALMGGAGELLAGGFIEVRVPEAFREQAQALLRELPLTGQLEDAADDAAAESAEWLKA
ncbi:hypothetical protein CO611_08620 [Lysobacteraceae bacterium NML03-0222]|nr:hypothetical protein CO611_08620 [Xanthomonadaceae bacterium NML03-0222]PJK04364.1 hypothetical protein CO612_07145 [Xanthomonadaceae bacterium NML71-0210]